jgi:hypothetical protein
MPMPGIIMWYSKLILSRYMKRGASEHCNAPLPQHSLGLCAVAVPP